MRRRVKGLGMRWRFYEGREKDLEHGGEERDRRGTSLVEMCFLIPILQLYLIPFV